MGLGASVLELIHKDQGFGGRPPGGASKFNWLRSLVTKLLPNIDEVDLADIMSLNNTHRLSPLQANLLHNDDILDAVPENIQRDIEEIELNNHLATDDPHRLVAGLICIFL